MRPRTLDIDPIDVDADGIAETQTPAASGVQSLTLNGALCDLGSAGEFDIYDAGYSDGIAGVRIGITSAADESGRTFTITGTDDLDRSVVEAVTGVDTGVAESVAYFKTISGITTDDDTTGAITVGPVDEVVSRTIPLNWRKDEFLIGLGIDVTGTIDYTVQHTFSTVYDISVTPKWFNHDNLFSQTTDQDGNYIIPVHATRLVVNSYDSGAEINHQILSGG